MSAMDRIFIEGLVVDAEIGIHDFERGVRQRLLFDIELDCDCRRAARSDAIADAIDYASVATIIAEVAANSSYQLIEALAEHVASVLLTRFPVEVVRVTLRKPGAVPEATAVGVAIERHRTV